MKRLSLTLVCMAAAAIVQAQTTLEDCQQAAQANYPLIRKYDLIARSAEVEVQLLDKDWLPQVNVSAQATLQNRVAQLPDALTGMMRTGNMGDAEGLKKDQYRIGFDVQQMVYDGGTVRHRKELARLQGEADRALNDVEMYAVRGRVNELFFGVLLLDEQLKLNDELGNVLASAISQLESLYKNGLAARSDLDNVLAEHLLVGQQRTSLLSQRSRYLLMLSAFCGKTIDHPVKPEPITVTEGNARPELRLAETKLSLADEYERLLQAKLKPRLSVFASGFYGYPGYDMFHDMLNRDFTFNALIGAKITWNIGSLYTLKTDKAKIALLREQAENQREVFLFNNRMEQIRDREQIASCERLMADDRQVVDLRNRIRRAAESKLANGIIDVNDLVKEINAENQAKISLSTHETEWLKTLYDLRYRVNK